ncbi:hypothetical protein [Mesorhizobium sp.]
MSLLAPADNSIFGDRIIYTGTIIDALILTVPTTILTIRKCRRGSCS